MIIPGRLTDSTSGTASAVTVAALADGTTYANDVAAIRSNLATLTLAVNKLTDCVAFLTKRLNDLEAE